MKYFLAIGPVTVTLLALFLAFAGCVSAPKLSEPQVSSGDPWFASVRTSDIAVLQGMIDGGKDVNSASASGATALMVASRNGSVETVKWLLSKGADAKTFDQQGQSALVYALVGSAEGVKRDRLVEYLLQAGSDPFKYDAIGFQPLREMIELGMNDQVMKLRFSNQKPCDLIPKDPKNVSLAQIARLSENVQLAEFFEKEGCW